MNNDARRALILEIARDEGKVGVDELAGRFNVAPQTVRRDLAHFSKTGELKRVRGGAAAPSGLSNIGYIERQKLNAEGKKIIARQCATNIPDDVAIFINSGTTTEAVARELLKHSSLLVVTNSLNVANILSANPKIEIVVAGGTLRRSDGGLLGNLTTQVVDHFKFDFSVISCAGIDEDGDLLDFDLQEVNATQAIIKRSRSTIVVADSSKILRIAPGRIGSLQDVDMLITDAELTSELQKKWLDFGVVVSLPKTDPMASDRGVIP